jgi:hypothetical protein
MSPTQAAYVMQFDGGGVSHMRKIRNDMQALRGLGRT